jgi:hypothetical protein
MPYTPRDRGGRPTVGLGFAAENLDVAEANITAQGSAGRRTRGVLGASPATRTPARLGEERAVAGQEGRHRPDHHVRSSPRPPVVRGAVVVCAIPQCAIAWTGQLRRSGQSPPVASTNALTS